MPPSKRKPVLIGRDIAALRPVVVGPQYEAGVCNIGPAEIARRRLFGHVAAAVGLVMLAVLIVLHVTPLARLIVALPAAAAATGYIQARLRFCAAYGSRGVYNLDGEVGKVNPILDAAARARDRARSARISLAAAAIGVASGIVAVLLPV